MGEAAGGPEGIEIPVRVIRSDLDRGFERAERRVGKERKDREGKEKGFRFALLGGVIGGALGTIAAGTVQKGGMSALGPLLEIVFSLFLITMLPFIRAMLPFIAETLAPFILDTLWPFLMNNLFPVMMALLAFFKDEEGTRFFEDPDVPGSGKRVFQAGGVTLEDLQRINKEGPSESDVREGLEDSDDVLKEFGEAEVPRMARDEDFDTDGGQE